MEMLLLNILKEQQYESLPRRTSIGTARSTDGNPMPMHLKLKLAFITVNFKLGEFFLINCHTLSIKNQYSIKTK
jgi:hypothetical protein